MPSRTGPVFVKLMANDYESEKSDLHGSPEAADTDRPAMDDPLLELARIVHKNNQLGANVSSGRVGSTDYFAGLNDFADDVADKPQSGPQRVEPSFPNTAFRPGNTGAPPLGPDNHPAPIVGEIRNQFFARTGSESTLPAADVPPLDTQPHGGERAENVSPLWPRLDNPQADAPAAVAVPGTPVQDVEVEPVREPLVEPSGYRTETAGEPAVGFARNDQNAAAPLAPSVAMDIEQSLTAELEDELIGALRQSVDEEVAKPAVAPMEEAASTDAFADITEAVVDHDVSATFAAEPAARVEETRWSEESATRQPLAEAPSSYLEPDLTNRIGQTGVGTGNPDFSAMSQVAPARPHLESADDVRRPAIDENELFSALNTADSAQSSASGLPQARQDRESPAGIDALFADLDFPERENRAPVLAEPEALEPDPEPVATADDIDEMAWPEAANAVPDVEVREDDTPPPPEGYDLDAVARAMQESDPSLSGAGVLPPHPETERVAADQSTGRSRRGLYAALGVVGVAALGGAGFFLYDGNSVQVPSGPPPVISGLQEPLKIFPEQSQSNAAGQSSTKITDRLQSTGESVPERLNIPETPQPVELPPAPAASDGSSELAPGTPKQVRTVIVRPDGTIVSGDEAPVISAPTTVETPAPQAPEITAPAVTAETPQIVATETVNAVPVQTEPIVVAPQTQETPVPETVPVQPQAEETATPVAVEPAAPAVPETVTQTDEPVQAETETQVPAAPVPTVVPRKKPQAPVQVAAAPVAQAAPAAQSTPPTAQRQNGPLNLANTGTAQNQPAASASGSIPSGTYIVQVTSQRSAAAARDAYAGLQRSYPGVLGNRNAVIVSADLGDRGVFYRARIPTGSRSEANSLCESLKGAGGDCFVRRQP